ncbi:IgA Peptidase M64, partial [Rhizoctonia solani]
MRSILLSLITIPLCLVAAHEAININDQAGYEVWLTRDRASGRCDVLSARSILLHKALRHTPSHAEIKPSRCMQDSRSLCQTDDILVVGYDLRTIHYDIARECIDFDTEPGITLAQPQLFLSQSYAPELDINPLSDLITGPTPNRINIVFFSDGYTSDEKQRFIDDATRLGHAISVNQTYAPVAPLINFWGAFTPSKESGIGVGGKPKEYAHSLSTDYIGTLSLYPLMDSSGLSVFSDGTELRGVYTSKPKVSRKERQASGVSDWAQLRLGNDPLYGGLGGEFTYELAISYCHLVHVDYLSQDFHRISVKRHELGHSIIWVGDEYDGSMYFGVNADNYTHRDETIGWAHWLSDPASPPRIERNSVPLLVYPWTMLNKSTPWSTNFTVDGTFDSALLRTSLSGIPESSHLTITLDGTTVTWEANPEIGLDRWFYDVPIRKLANDTHELKFVLEEKGKEGLAQLCSLEVIEYGNATEFNSTEGYVGAFPTYSPLEYEDPDPEPDRPALHDHHNHKKWATTSYRPTNEDCLMRQVAQPNFCVVCTEGLWLRLLSRVSLIDKVSFYDSLKGDADTGIELSLISLAQFRSPAEAEYLARRGTEETYLIRWFTYGQEVKKWQNSTRVDVECRAVGIIEVEVEFVSSEIRKDEKGYTKDRYRLLLDC